VASQILHQRLPSLAITLALLAAATPAFAFDAAVTRCHDGDTCTLADGERVRLHAIDAPELDQPYGDQARVLINRLVAGQHVDVRPTGDRSYGRMVADIGFLDCSTSVPAGADRHCQARDVGTVMVSAGLAWEERRWDNNQASRLVERQAEAQAAHRGLWAGVDPVPPWTWRHQHVQSWQGPAHREMP
jgi:micrococcal nuclease